MKAQIRGYNGLRASFQDVARVPFNSYARGAVFLGSPLVHAVREKLRRRLNFGSAA
jgi:hypothetical protein